MRAATVSIVVLACGVLTLAIPNPPSPFERLTDSEINLKVEEAARSMPSSGDIPDDALRGLIAEDRMDSIENDNKQISKRFFHSEPEPEPAPPAHGWGSPPAHGWGPPPAHQGPGMGLVGPFAFQLGAYYNPYLPVPMNQGYSSPPAAYGSPAPQPYTVQKAPSYESSSTSYTTPAPSYGSTYTTTAAPSYGSSSYSTSAPSYGSSSYSTSAPSYGSSSYSTSAPSYGSSSSYGSYSTPAPSYGSSSSYGSYSTPAPSYGDSYSHTPANPIILGYTASASYPSQGYGSSSSYSSGY